MSNIDEGELTLRNDVQLNVRRVVLYALLVTACGMLLPYLWSRAFSSGNAVRVRSTAPPVLRELPGDQLRVACFNIAHGRGLPFDNWNGETKKERKARLDDIAKLLQDTDADIIALNEVDFDASWSHRVNQAEYLARQAGYEYWAEQRNLDFQIGWWSWRFGNAILSKYPIANAELIGFPGLRKWETLAAGKKSGLLATIKLDTRRDIQLAAAHLSHRSEQLRVESARQLCSVAKHADDLLIVAGDLNSTPPDFPESVQTPSGENAISEFDASQLFTRRPTDHPRADEFTFPADNPVQTIDWILVPRPCAVLSYEVVETTLSDHRPVVAEVRLP